MNKIKYKAIATGITCIMGWAFCLLSAKIFREYALGLFIWLPFGMGLINTLIYGMNYRLVKKEVLTHGILTLTVFYLGLLLFAMEGLICMIMAAPVGFAFFLLGAIAAKFILLYVRRRKNISAVIIVCALSIPACMAFDTLKEDEPLRAVTTVVEIAAPPEKVWENVIKFRPLNNPPEWIFKTGIAYPVNATIEGEGIGAVRYCNFSTGSFIEPITVWNKPECLQFNVTAQPEPMKEISLYTIHPPHLKGYWISKQGRFRLIRLANGHTRLEGTTWYINKIRPGFYWNAWSDYIVHAIHERVLQHIKEQAEKI